MTAYLRGREEVVRALGWKIQYAEWIALVCLTGGYFTRAQLAVFLGVGYRRARHIVREMLKREIVTEAPLEGRMVCRVPGIRIYRALRVPYLCPRAAASMHLVMRRLLSLDYVLEHPGLCWLPAEAEQVGAFDALGIGREHLPSRLCGGKASHHFPDGLPIAVDGGRAHFAFADPGYAVGVPFRRWAKAHRPLWEMLRVRGYTVEVVAVVRTVRELQRARRQLKWWSRPVEQGSEEGRAVRRELGQIERTILEGNDDALAPYGDIQGALRRIVELRKLERSLRPEPTVDAFDIWRSDRLRGGWS